MNLELSEEQQELVRTAREFSQSRLGQNLRVHDGGQCFDYEAWKACAEFGLLRMPVSKKHGGLGAGLTDLIAVMEGIGSGSADMGLLLSIHAHLWTNVIPILQFGTPHQIERYIPSLIDGTWIGANAASEPGSGSDVFSMRSRAVRNGDHYVLNGAKTFVTNAEVADVFVAYATIDPERGSLGVTAFIVERGTPGLSIGKAIEKMGLRTSPMCEVIFEECVVPVENRLGREGRGVQLFDCSMEWERGCILAGNLGRMRSQLDRCIEHARSRRQFGQPIGKFQAVANRIVDMHVRLETCRYLVYRIGSLKEAGKDARLEAAMAKLYVSEAFVQSSMDAMRTFGGYGYMVEQNLERELRDAMGGVFYSGTSDIQRNIIAGELGL